MKLKLSKDSQDPEDLQGKTVGMAFQEMMARKVWRDYLERTARMALLGFKVKRDHLGRLTLPSEPK